MPRIARIIVPDVAVHVTQRGNNGQICFFRSSDYRNYLRYLRVFAARCLVPTEHYVLACYRYIELNPVRAGMVSKAGQYPWSSHLANCSREEDSLLSAHPALDTLGMEDGKRNAAYRALFDSPLESPVVEEIRKATRNGHRLGTLRKRRGRQVKGAEMGPVPMA